MLVASLWISFRVEALKHTIRHSLSVSEISIVASATKSDPEPSAAPPV